MFQKQILVNLRTYDDVALIFYANDHLNNFVHLYIENGTQVVFLFNHGNVIHNVTVSYAKLNSSNPVQIAIERNKQKTTVHVNEKNQSIPFGVLLLDEYSPKPWTNPDDGEIICLRSKSLYLKWSINLSKRSCLHFQRCSHRRDLRHHPPNIFS